MSRPSQWWNECSDGHCCAYHAIEEIRCAESVLLHASGIFATIFTMVYLLFNLDRTVVGCILMTITSVRLSPNSLFIYPNLRYLATSPRRHTILDPCGSRIADIWQAIIRIYGVGIAQYHCHTVFYGFHCIHLF